MPPTELSKIPGYRTVLHASRSSTSLPCAVPSRSAEINAHLLEHGILGGYDLGQDYPALKNHMLIAVTEMNSKEEIDTLVEVLRRRWPMTDDLNETAKIVEPTIFDLSSPGRTGVTLPDPDVPLADLPTGPAPRGSAPARARRSGRRPPLHAPLANSTTAWTAASIRSAPAR